MYLSMGAKGCGRMILFFRGAQPPPRPADLYSASRSSRGNRWREEHACIDLIQELLTIILISLHTDPDMLGIAECACGSPCRDNIDAKRQSPSSQQARRVRSGNPISDPQ